MKDYLNAVKFVTNCLLSNSDAVAYAKTFPDRYKRLIDEGMDDKTIYSFVSKFKSNKQVSQILSQTLVPIYVLNAPLLQEAINVQVDLMYNAKREDVRQLASKTLIEKLTPPESAKINMKIEVDETTKLQQAKLIEHVGNIALNQQRMLAAGLKLEDIQKLNLSNYTIDVEDNNDEE